MAQEGSRGIVWSEIIKQGQGAFHKRSERTGKPYCKEVVRNDKNRRLFRHVARESSGETYDPPEDETLCFLYLPKRDKNELVAVGSFQRPSPQQPGVFTVSYLFVKGQFKGSGYGSKLLQFMERRMLHWDVIHVQSAERAVSFFGKHGYNTKGDAIRSVCAGSPLFCVLYNMEKRL